MLKLETNAPLVSICCITYNHAKYLRDCLEGFLCQRTNFPFEVLIHDDASTDGAQDIIKEYQRKFPDIIKPILQEKNQYSQGKLVSFFNTDRARGHYLAFCEGDDFWCNPDKLQTQFDFMESHPEYSFCGCAAWVLSHFSHTISGSNPTWNFPPSFPDSTRGLYFGRHPFLTSGLFIRRSSFLMIQEKYKRDLYGAAMGDALLMFHLSLVGEVGYIPRIMTVYRIACGSVSSYGNSVSRENTKKKMLDTSIRLAKNNGFDEWAEELLKSDGEQKKTGTGAHRQPDTGFFAKLYHVILHVERGDFWRYAKYLWRSHRHLPVFLSESYNN